MFGRSRREKRFTQVALDAQAEWAALSDIDKKSWRDALDDSVYRRDGNVRALPRAGRAARAASAVRNLPARVGRPAPAVAEGADDTMVVSSAAAWRLYQRTAAFVCEPDRALRPVRFMAFEVDGNLQREVPRIIAIRDHVPFTSAEQRRLMTSGTELDLRLADVIATARRLGLDGAVHQVYLLTAPAQGGHVSLPAPVSWKLGMRRRLQSPAAGELERTSVERLRASR